MASCQTWSTATHFRHPWFDKTVMKRKHPETVSPDEDVDDTPGSTSARPPPKRRRCSVLENGFAHLSIAGTNTRNDHSVPSASTYLYPHVLEVPPPVISNAMDAGMLSPHAYPNPAHISAYTVEEPTIPEVKMKVSSWYELEPDRIVITDLDSFTQSDDEEEEEENMTINPALLDRILTNRFDSSTRPSSSPPTMGTSQALVLFKPLPRLGDSHTETEIGKELLKEQEQEENESKQVEVDENAMDVEP